MNHTITIIVNGKRYPDFYVGGSHTDEELVAMLDEDIDLNDPDTWYRVYWDLPDQVRYIVEDTRDHGDTFTEVYETAEEANAAAAAAWNHLTAYDRKDGRRIRALVVKGNDLDDPDDWESYTSADDFPGAFDSGREYRILPEYLNEWGTTEGNDIVTYAEIDRLANEWGMALADLMEQVEEK